MIASRIPRRTDKSVNEVDERGETVLYDQAGGKLLVLNDVAAGVWALVDGTRSVAEIAEIVREHLPKRTKTTGAGPATDLTDVTDVEADLETFLKDLEHHELVAFG